MTRRNRGRGMHEIQEIDNSILQNHPPPEMQNSSFYNSQQSNYVEDLYVKSKMPTNSYGRISPISVKSEMSDAETIVSRSVTSRSLSSASTWTDDVYEEESAHRVQYLFDAIDSLLYEGTELPDEFQDLDSECQYWSQAFPHLRISGSKLNILNEHLNDFCTHFPPSQIDNAHQIAAIDTVKRASSGKSEKILSLMVQGISLRPLLVHADVNTSDDCNIIPMYEEIIEQDGEYEELIAIDFSDDKKKFSQQSDEMQSQSNAEIQCQQLILEWLIKDIWDETINRLRPFLSRCKESLWKGVDYKYNKNYSNKVPENDALDEFSLTRQPLAQDYTDLQGLLTISSKTLLDRNSDKSGRNLAQTSAPPAMVGARLSSAHRGGFYRSARGRLAPLERSVKTSIPTSTHMTYQDNWKAPSPLPPPPVSPHAWGRHFPLPPIEGGLQASSTPIVSSIQKLKPTCSAIIRMLSGSNNRRGVMREASKIPVRITENHYSSSPVSLINTKTNRLLSAQVDTMKTYPASYAAIGERVKSTTRQNDFRHLPESLNKGRGKSFDKVYGIQENPNKDRFPSGYSHRNFDRKNR